MKHLVEVFWSDDDEGYIAVVPDLPGCSAFGTTPEAVVHEIGDATLAWIAACRASGDPIPKPIRRNGVSPKKRGQRNGRNGKKRGQDSFPREETGSGLFSVGSNT